MQPSIFNVQVPVAERNEVFLMNTLSDAQLLVSQDVAALLERVAGGRADFTADERETLDTLVENGFIVESRDAEHRALTEYFTSIREDTEQMKVTILTTLQCNFACDYCFQGDHGDYNKFAAKMSLDTARAVARWIEERLEAVGPRKLHITFFGGEPLLNLPVTYYLAERCKTLCDERGVTQSLSIITNGLLLTPEVVDRLMPFGLMGVKITLDGDRDTHNRMRPLRGRQGTFDRIIENVRRVADRLPITIGGNFDESSWDSYPALLDFLKEQDFSHRIAKINFKPIIKAPEADLAPKGVIPLTLVGANDKPLAGTCMTIAGAGGGVGGRATSACDSCHFVDEKMTYLRDETRKHGFATADGVHMGPCEIHRRHAYTIGPDGALYACPGFTGDAGQSTGHINGSDESWRHAAAERFERLSAHKEECGDCSFVPVCGGGCSVAAHTELGDMYRPSCHKGAMESALVSFAQRAAASVVNAGLSAN
jgi:uncharacterized protein